MALPVVHYNIDYEEEKCTYSLSYVLASDGI